MRKKPCLSKRTERYLAAIWRLEGPGYRQANNVRKHKGLPMVRYVAIRKLDRRYYQAAIHMITKNLHKR